MNHTDMMGRVKAYLSEQLDCTPADLEKTGTVFLENRRQTAPFLNITAIGEAVVVSASPELLEKVRPRMEGKSRDEIFEFPLVYGQSIHYLPDLRARRPLPLPEGFAYELLEGEELLKLRGIQGFENSLAFDAAGNTPTCIVLTARKEGRIAGLAGASAEAPGLWEMGVDVLPGFRRHGLASALVSNLTGEIIKRGVVPFYCASVTNLGSQAAAHRSGLAPCWVSTYSNILREGYAYPDLAVSERL